MPKPRTAAPKSVSVTLTMRINLALLRRQKRHLLGLCFGSVVSRAQDDTIEGVLNLIDFIQDSIVAQGLASDRAVFNTRSERKKQKTAAQRLDHS
jgi:hypothetical protein